MSAEIHWPQGRRSGKTQDVILDALDRGDPDDPAVLLSPSESDAAWLRTRVQEAARLTGRDDGRGVVRVADGRRGAS